MTLDPDVQEALRTLHRVRQLTVDVSESERGVTTSLTIRLGAEVGSTVFADVLFDGVSELRIQPAFSNWLLWVRVIDLRERGWDRLRYRVEDNEQNESIEFNCESITLLVRGI